MVGISAFTAKPCEHDNWDNVRIKKGTATLRCRECQAQWKVCHTSLPRCQTFLADGVCKDENCTAVHVNQFKQNLKTRRELHGDTVLENIPATFWDSSKKKKKKKAKAKARQEQVENEEKPLVLLAVDDLHESDSEDQVSTTGSACHSESSTASSFVKRVVYVEDDGSTYVEEFLCPCLEDPMSASQASSTPATTPHARPQSLELSSY